MRYLLIILVVLVSTVNGFSQKKVKYKNLFPVLQSKDYKTAEADLLVYLADTKDEANAYFYLGELIASKLDTVKIFSAKDNTYDSLIDEAVKAYKTAISLVTEREVKKNDEYYMAYNRRDLRTGKFGIKLSDIHLDYENKIEVLLKKKDLVADIVLAKADALVAQSNLNDLVAALQSQYQSDEAFLLKISVDEQSTFDRLLEKSEELKEAISTYITKLKNLNHTLYKPQLIEKPIKSWADMADTELVFKDHEITSSNYEAYFKSLQQELTTEVAPLKKMLLETDDQLSKAIEENKVVKDSSKLVEAAIPMPLLEGLVAYSTSPLVVSILKYKSQKAELSTLSNSALNPILNDSNNVYQRTITINELYKQQKALLRAVEAMEKNINQEALDNFSFYLKGFQPSFEEYVVLEKTVTSKKVDLLNRMTDSLNAKINFVLHKKDTLYMPASSQAKTASNKIEKILTLEGESMLAAGTYKGNAFVAEIGYDMELVSLNSIKATTKVQNLIAFQDKYLVQLKGTPKASFKSALLLIDEAAMVLWQHDCQTEDILGAAKVEAGIFFIYNENEEIFLTLDSKGAAVGK